MNHLAMEAFVEAVRDALQKLDGSDAAAVSMMTGLSPEEINGLGGVRDTPLDDIQRKLDRE